MKKNCKWSKLFVPFFSFQFQFGHGVGPDGYSPLQEAAIVGHAPVVKFLSKFTENPNAPDPLGRTPLKVATQKNHHEVVQVLLQALLEKYPSNPQAICNNLAI